MISASDPARLVTSMPTMLASSSTISFDPRKVSKEMVEEDANIVGMEVTRRAGSLAEIIRRHRLAKPDRLFGFYSYVPLRDYWSHAQGMGSWVQWKMDSRLVADILAPEIHI